MLRCTFKSNDGSSFILLTWAHTYLLVPTVPQPRFGQCSQLWPVEIGLAQILGPRLGPAVSTWCQLIKMRQLWVIATHLMCGHQLLQGILYALETRTYCVLECIDLPDHGFNRG